MRVRRVTPPTKLTRLLVLKIPTPVPEMDWHPNLRISLIAGAFGVVEELAPSGLDGCRGAYAKSHVQIESSPKRALGAG